MVTSIYIEGEFNMSIKLPANKNEARELYLLITNDYQIYKQQFKPIIKMLTRRKLNGSYDSEKALKAFENLAITGAKKYRDDYSTFNSDNCIGGFTPATRRLTAIALRDQFEEVYDEGNYSDLV
tara:strand:+ start:102 stop:473 length:372 start_codon:yes stop_codon:yes gene_type:complete